MKQGDLFTVQMYADIPWVLACGGQKGELAIWDTEEDKQVREHFKGMMPEKAKTLKKKADRGMEENDEDMVEGEEEGDGDSGFEDVDSDDEKLFMESQDTTKEMKESSAEPTKKDKKSKKSKK